MRAAGDVRGLLVSTLLALVATSAIAAPAAAQAPGQTRAADPLQHRLAQATHVRGALRARWEALGAVPRPPRPAPLVEEPGEPPVEGARWLPGAWAWIDGRWVWHAGGWMLPGESVPADIAALGIGFALDFPIGDGDLDDRGGRAAPGPRIRDHRDGRAEPVTIRDHRDDKKADDRKDDKVRDHRDTGYDRPAPSPGGGGSGGATIRDHRR